jgi:hypothetical protein
LHVSKLNLHLKLLVNIVRILDCKTSSLVVAKKLLEPIASRILQFSAIQQACISLDQDFLCSPRQQHLGNHMCFFASSIEVILAITGIVFFERATPINAEYAASLKGGQGERLRGMLRS